jgi:hypothetical protein
MHRLGRVHIKGSSLRLTHVNASFDFLDTSSQLSIPGYFPPHSFYDTPLQLASVPPPIAPARLRQELFAFDDAHTSVSP